MIYINACQHFPEIDHLLSNENMFSLGLRRVHLRHRHLFSTKAFHEFNTIEPSSETISVIGWIERIRRVSKHVTFDVFVLFISSILSLTHTHTHTHNMPHHDQVTFISLRDSRKNLIQIR